jgi:hypothetical protein
MFEITALPYSFVVDRTVVGRAFVDGQDIYFDLPTAAYLMGFSSVLTVEMLLAEAYQDMYLIDGYKCVNIAFVWHMFTIGRFRFTASIMRMMQQKMLTVGFAQLILSEFLLPCQSEPTATS